MKTGDICIYFVHYWRPRAIVRVIQGFYLISGEWKDERGALVTPIWPDRVIFEPMTNSQFVSEKSLIRLWPL